MHLTGRRVGSSHSPVPTIRRAGIAAAIAAAPFALAYRFALLYRGRAGYPTPLGEVDRSKLNVMGGSIAIGHPFGATGGRVTTTLANEMKRRGTQFGLISVCAQGGMGFAMVLERS